MNVAKLHAYIHAVLDLGQHTGFVLITATLRDLHIVKCVVPDTLIIPSVHVSYLYNNTCVGQNDVRLHVR